MNIKDFLDLIIKFSIEITPYNEDFRLNILKRLNEIVPCSQLHFVFTDSDWSYSDSIAFKENNYRHFFDTEFFKKCPSHPQVFPKLFGKDYSHLCSSVLTNDMLISTTKFENLDFYKEFFIVEGMHYFALLHFEIPNKKIATIALLRSKSMGAFSDNETLLLELLKPLVYSRIMEYYEVSYIQHVKKIMSYSIVNSSMGIIYLDRNFNLFFKNSIAQNYINEICRNKNSIYKNMQDFLDKIFDKIIHKNNSKNLTISLENLQIEVSEISSQGFLSETMLKYILHLKKIEKSETFDILNKNNFLLTKRECEVAKLLISGLSNKEIAQFLNISINTVRTHIDNILSKTDTHSRSSAAAKLSQYSDINYT